MHFGAIKWRISLNFGVLFRFCNNNKTLQSPRNWLIPKFTVAVCLCRDSKLKRKAKLVISSFTEPRFPGKSKSEAIYDGGLLNLLSPSVVYFHPRAIYTFFFLSLQIDNFLSPFKLFSLFKWTRSGHSQVWRLRRGCLVGHRIRLKDVERTCSRRCCRWKSTLEESSACQTDQSWLPSGNSFLI